MAQTALYAAALIAAAATQTITAQAQTPAALRDDVAYLASEALGGRATPSPGLELAADYIAGRFRAAGLQPVFQAIKLRKGRTARNVAAILPGSDLALRSQYVILSAHYDHLGRDRRGAIYPGANDDASGTAALIELAAALAARPEKPARSVLFIAFAGEEEGLVGSSWYVAHPLVPLADTVAEINLEQIGRTDDSQGPKVRSFSMTGSAQSNLAEILDEAAAGEGVTLYRRPDDAQFFERSDNFPFARHGVTDTTLVVTFDFADYHKPSDTADKLDYDNLSAVSRAIGAAVLEIANDPGRPVRMNPAPLLP